jgi:hypothetical protein
MTEMPLAEHTHMIKALPSDGTDQLASAAASVDHECPWIELFE